MAQTGSETQRNMRHQIVTSFSYCCRSILYPRFNYDKACKYWYSTTLYHLENRFEALMNAGEESPNVIKHGSDQPAANTATNRRSRSRRQRHSAQSAAEPRTLIVGDSIIRNISSRTTTTCCLPQATVSDVNKELQNILMKHKTANRIIIHVGKNDIRKEQSELLKKDFSELFETLRRLKVQSFISGPLPARGTNMFSRLLGLNTWLQRSCNIKGVNFIDNFNLFWGHRQLFKPDGLHPNKLGARVLKDNIYFCLRHPSAEYVNSFSTHTPGPSHHVVDISHKDTDNTIQPQQALLMDTIPAEPCPQSSSQTDCDVSKQIQDSAPKDDLLENSQGSQDNISQSLETPETQPLSPDTLSLSPASPLLCFSQKMEELVYAGTKLSHSFAASPQISPKKRRAPQPPKPVGPAPVRALRPLPQRQGPNPPSAVGEPKTTDSSSQ
uniref:OSK domain-containing protein n=1 Tax=Cyprinus carpio TaxID=7962 RepID=A0A8C2ENE0_CYPCA